MDLFSHLAGAYADNTLRAYRADFKVFKQWCDANQVDPLNSSPERVAEYVHYEAKAKSTATIRRRIASLSSLFKLNKLDDTTGSPEVVLALKRIHRQKGRAQKQAYPLTRDLLDQLLDVCGDDLKGQRDRVMLLLGYETMRRRSELCSFRFEDIEVLPRGRNAIRLRFSKTDQYGEGKLLPISNDLVQAIQDWKAMAGLKSGFILRGLTKSGSVRASLSPSHINLRLKELAEQINMQPSAELSGHSFRVGAAIDLLEAGESLEKIMLRGGWQSEATAIRYLRGWRGFW